MKRAFSILLAGILTLGLAACGNSGGSGGESKNVDLEAFFASAEKQQGWEEGYMADIPDEMLDTYYPGLRDLETKQFLAKAPMMSGVVNEVVLLECTSEDDAQKAADILNQRVTEQADGGAWYPESIEAWSNALVTTNGNYAALLVTSEGQSKLADSYNALFE